MARKYALPWGDEELTFNLPEAWEVLGTLQPNEVPPVEDVNECVASSLESPIGMAPLQALLSPEKKVIIVIDDISRPTPIQEIIPHVMTHLRNAGVRLRDI